MNKVSNFLFVLLFLGVLTACSDSDDPIIDDSETPQGSFDLRDPKAWSLASTPQDFPEASLYNDVDYGKNRALLSWYSVGPFYTHNTSSHVPGYIRNDLDGLSYPYVREVYYSEVFPGLDVSKGGNSAIETLSLSFYPRERGPYNLDAENIDQDGYLLYPEKRWGGIMRYISEYYDLSEVKYIQFWMLDPFMDPDLDNRDGGYLFFNMGVINEDVLNDGLISAENKLPVDGDTSYIHQTCWGKVSTKPTQTNYVTIYDNSSKRNLQDVGLDGLTNQEEYVHPTYANFLNKLRAILPQSTVEAMYNDPFSPFNDPAGDNYAFYYHDYYDRQKCHIIERYKHCNGPDGNSLPKELATDSQYQEWYGKPESEDINWDESLNGHEGYYQYRVSIHPDSMMVGKNYITDKQVARVVTRNGNTQEATWYQFTIPLVDYQKKIGSISGYSNIRFMRIYMTGFKRTTHLRFATLELVNGD